MKFSNSDDVAAFARTKIFAEGTIEYVEQFYVLLLDTSNQLFAWKQISIGGVSYTVVDPVLEIPILDHLILTNEEFYSFADEGEM